MPKVSEKNIFIIKKVDSLFIRLAIANNINRVAAARKGIYFIYYIIYNPHV